MSEQPPGKTRSRLTLFILVGIFIAPILGAYIVHKYKALQPTGSKSFGAIVTPARPLPEFNLKTIDGKVFDLESIRRKWSYVYIIKSECGDACQLNLLKMRNARLAQGAEAQRVRYYLVFAKRPEQQSSIDEIVKVHPKLTILHGSESELKTFFESFKDAETDKVPTAQRVYMIDPIGNYMMYYSDGFESIGIMEDLKHLLKWSQIG